MERDQKVLNWGSHHSLLADRMAEMEAVMTNLSIQEFQSRLPAVLDDLKPGEELLITRDNKPPIRMIGESTPPRLPRRPGSCVGMAVILSEDEDYMEDFADQMS